MKKTISILISVLLAFTLASPAFASAAGENSLYLAVASDLHFNIPREQIEGSIDDEIYYYANRRAAMEDESGFIIDEFLRQCAENDLVDYVLISGDLADNGKSTPDEHYAVAEKLAKFERETGKSVYVCNGNHDSGNNCETENETFREIYNDFGYGEALETMDGNLSYTVNLGEKYRLIVADSCNPNKSTEDGLDSSRVSWIVEQAGKAYKDGKYPLLMMHHNLLDHMPVQRVLSHNFIVQNHVSTADRLANAGIKVVLTGHEHGSDVISHTTLSGKTITDFSTSSLTMYPLSYRLMSFEDEKISYSSETIDSIDLEALTEACGGYSEEQLSLMSEGLNDYAKGFFKAGIKYRLWLSLTPEKLGVDEDSIIGPVVYTAVDRLLDILDTPLYGEGGVVELAAEYGIDLPETEYSDGWDLATELVAYHYAGNEPFALDSPEVTLLLYVADLIILDALSSVNDEVFLSAANKVASSFGTGEICKNFTKTVARNAGPVTAGEYLIVAIASPLLYGLAYDRDGLDDNNGEIDGYAVNNASANLAAKFGSFFSDVLLYFKLFLSYVIKALVG